MPRKRASSFGKPHCPDMDGTTAVSGRIAGGGSWKGNARKDSARPMDGTGRLAIIRRRIIRNAPTSTTRWGTPGNCLQQSGHDGYGCRTARWTDHRTALHAYKSFGKTGGRAEVFGGDISHCAVVKF